MNSTSKAADLVTKLGLLPHPEGGWYGEVFRSHERVQTRRGERTALTTIYYLLERHQLSRWHVVESDEVWHFYAGEPLDLLEYDPVSHRLVKHVLGDVGEGNASVAVIPAGVWQAARPHGEYSLVGCSVGPGFEYEDFCFVQALPGHMEHFSGELAQFANLL
jgi:predicted cupin superfamily sugar epimerase